METTNQLEMEGEIYSPVAKDIVTDYNQAEGDIATPDCENF
jgi:hypothetical protein